MRPVNALIFLPFVAVGLLRSAGVISQGQSLLLSGLALAIALAGPKLLARVRPESAVVRQIEVGPRDRRAMVRFARATLGLMVVFVILAMGDVISMRTARAVLVTGILVSLVVNMVWFTGKMRNPGDPPHDF